MLNVFNFSVFGGDEVNVWSLPVNTDRRRSALSKVVLFHIGKMVIDFVPDAPPCSVSFLVLTGANKQNRFDLACMSALITPYRI